MVLNATNCKVLKKLSGGSKFVEDWKNLEVDWSLIGARTHKPIFRRDWINQFLKFTHKALFLFSPGGTG